MQYTKLNGLLSPEDVMRFGYSIDGRIYLDDERIKPLFSDKYNYKKYVEILRQRLIQFFRKYPKLEGIERTLDPNVSMPVSILSYEDNLIRAGFEGTLLLGLFIRYFYERYNNIKGIDYPEFTKESHSDDEFYELTYNYLSKAYEALKRKIEEESTPNKIPIYNMPNKSIVIKDSQKQKALEATRNDLKALIYLKKHLKEIFDDFNLEYDEEIFSLIDIDKLEFSFALVAYYIVCDNEGRYTEEQKELAVQFLEKYFILTEYISKRVNKPYETKLVANGVISTYDQLKLCVEKECIEQKELFDKYNSGVTIEEILNTSLIDARRKIRQDDIEHHLKVKWNIVPKGTREGVIFSNNSSSKVKNKDNMESIDFAEKDQKLLEEKQAFYPTTDYKSTIEGRDAYEGYGGFLYSNGLVVLEKFCRQKGNEVLPVHYEGFIIMNIVDLIEMSKYTKSEIMDLKREGRNKSAQRKYHSSKWKENLLNLINKKSYFYDYSEAEIEEIMYDVLSKATEEEKKLELQ